MLFYPSNPLYRRGVIILSAFSCTFAGFHVAMADFGTQRHVFTSLQAFVTPKIDAYFGITQAEIDTGRVERRLQATIAAAEAEAAAKSDVLPPPPQRQ